MTDHSAPPAQPAYPAQPAPQYAPPGPAFPPQGFPPPVAGPRPRNTLALAALIVALVALVIGFLQTFVQSVSFDISGMVQNVTLPLMNLCNLIALVLGLISVRRTSPLAIRWAGYVAIGMAGSQLLQTIVFFLAFTIRYNFF